MVMSSAIAPRAHPRCPLSRVSPALRRPPPLPPPPRATARPRPQPPVQQQRWRHSRPGPGPGFPRQCAWPLPAGGPAPPTRGGCAWRLVAWAPWSSGCCTGRWSWPEQGGGEQDRDVIGRLDPNDRKHTPKSKAFRC